MDPTLEATLLRARQDPNYGFDTVRDELAALPVAVLPELLATALDPAWLDLRPQLVAALGDWAWPGAYEAYVGWAGGEDWFLALDAGCALDTAGGGGFGFWDKVAPGDAPSKERVLEQAPLLLAWWRETGAAQAPDEAAWRASLGRLPSPQERTFMLVRSTGWAVLDDGSVIEDSGPLPRNAGTHLCAGEIDVDGIGTVPVVFVLDSSREDPIAEAMVESTQGWLNVLGRATARRPRNTVGDAPPRECRYEVGPTGSLRPRG